MIKKIENEAEFINLIEKIDQNLSSTPIGGRYLRIFLEISKLYPNPNDVGQDLFSNPKAVDGDYTGISLSGHIKNWCDERYGSKQKMEIDPGFVVFDFFGQRWKLAILLVIVSRNGFHIEWNCDGEKERKEGEKYFLNMRRMFIDLPNGLAKKLQNENLNYERQIVGKSICAINRLLRLEKLPYVKEALTDFRGVSSELIKDKGSFGNSRWLTLQFIEKILKAYLNFKGSKILKTHDLIKLSSATNSLGMPLLDVNDLNSVNCEATVRYGETPCTAQEALEAHHASIRLAYDISEHLAKDYLASLKKG